MKVDGKFMVNGDIPEGQASVNELLAECFELAYELRIAAEEAEEAGESNASDAPPSEFSAVNTPTSEQA
jgi:hypothetical protein